MPQTSIPHRLGLKMGLAAATLLIVAATPAFAVSITNYDTHEHTVTVDRGATQKDRKVSSGDTLQIDCPERCGFRVVGSGYGRQPVPDGKLIIDKGGMLRFAEETDSQSSQ